MLTRSRSRGARGHHEAAAHIARRTSRYYDGDRGVAALRNDGELPEGRGVSHAFKGKSPSSRRTRVWRKVLVREMAKTAPAGRENTKLRQREIAKQQKIATLQKIEPSLINSVPTDFLEADNTVIFSNSTGTATPTGNGGR
jgi:hypothetical protein